ncbi:MAG TPA: hydrogenase maturation nickel metallochaperone HypA [Polyangiaceae bacterium]|nr:hydrogenase maturation nickel metallochaperone HypA [Polyangiaceae bacterium]
MHEMALTQDLLELVSERFADRRVTRVILEVGKLAAVVPDAFRFCFELCAAGTVAEGAALEIVETPGSARCRGCESTVALETFFASCVCGSSDLELLTGDELRLKAVEVV